MKLNSVQVFATNQVFKRLNILRRWTSLVTENKYNELCKQALNCIVAYLLASYSEEAGMIIKWERFPKIALYRAFQKVYVYFDTPEHILNEIREIGNFPKDAFNNATNSIIAEQADSEFAEFLSEGLGTYEMRIYRAATKISTNIELAEIANKMDFHDYRQKSIEISDSLKEFNDLPGIENFADIDGELFKVLLKIASLRNKNRWAVQTYCMDCSVLGHLFDTGVFAYFIALEQKPNDESNAAKMFFMGIYHDIAETWTSDIPSPIKDRIPGFRAATEQFELRVLEKELYSKVPEFLKKKLKEVMMEDESNLEYKKLLKGADYLSADSECWRQYKAGSRDEYFVNVPLKNDLEKIETGKVVMTPICKQLFDTMYAYAKGLNL